MDIDNLTIGEAKKLAAMFSTTPMTLSEFVPPPHPMLNRRCIIRTYSAGVHIGTVVSVTNGMEVHLKDALRLWCWGADSKCLSLSAVATKGIKSGRLNRTPEVYLTNAIEFIPTTPEAEVSFVKFVET